MTLNEMIDIEIKRCEQAIHTASNGTSILIYEARIDALKWVLERLPVYKTKGPVKFSIAGK